MVRCGFEQCSRPFGRTDLGLILLGRVSSLNFVGVLAEQIAGVLAEQIAVSPLNFAGVLAEQIAGVLAEEIAGVLAEQVVSSLNSE
ncbi:hypothetical protein DM860_012803 [Cuscuta australis]|uniref:Uncharacterized protein n=1 Tax=Cuscuta australis TaxID=267555 RepID=A0A328DVX4_9ASTE|nr:hypothetical protein DM860_012803 [Cuscuta australis]